MWSFVKAYHPSSVYIFHRSGTANRILEEKEKARAKEKEPERKKAKRYVSFRLHLSTHLYHLATVHRVARLRQTQNLIHQIQIQTRTPVLHHRTRTQIQTRRQAVGHLHAQGKEIAGVGYPVDVAAVTAVIVVVEGGHFQRKERVVARVGTAADGFADRRLYPRYIEE